MPALRRHFTMDKKLALVTLIERSIALSDEAKLALFEKIETMTDEDAEKLGAFLAAERDYVLENEDGIKKSVAEVMDDLAKYTPEPKEQVYVGTGKAG